MTRWSAISRTRRSRSALAYGSRFPAAAATTSIGSYTTSGDATRLAPTLSVDWTIARMSVVRAHPPLLTKPFLSLLNRPGHAWVTALLGHGPRYLPQSRRAATVP
jgi:hypothetical protein